MKKKIILYLGRPSFLLSLHIKKTYFREKKEPTLHGFAWSLCCVDHTVLILPVKCTELLLRLISCGGRNDLHIHSLHFKNLLFQ